MITQQCRPKTYDEVAGQDLNIKILKAISQNPETAPRSLIFQGSFGCGKSTCARIFARALNCKHPKADGSPCGKCDNCLADINNTYFYQEFDASVIGNVDEIRRLRDTFQYTVSEGYKVICFDEAHLSSRAAQSALLKVIEEVQGRVIFIFATTDVDKLLDTIRSRSLELRFLTVPEPEVVENLKSVASRMSIDIDEETLKIIANRSNGHMRNAHMLLDQYQLLGKTSFLESVASSRDQFIKYIVGLVQKDKNKVLSAISSMTTFTLADLKSDYEQFLCDLLKSYLGFYDSDPKVVQLAGMLKANTTKIVKACMSKWVIDSFESDLQFQTALLALFQLMTGV